mgnify:FL=1
MACRYYQSQLGKKGETAHLVNLYGIEDLEETAQIHNNYGSSTPYLPSK